MDTQGRKKDGGVVMLPVGCSTLKCHMGTRIAGPSCGVKGREPRLAHLPWYAVRLTGKTRLLKMTIN
jgi:hypothetical protein